MVDLEFKTDEQLNIFDINENDILSITKNLNASKVHEWDKISVRMNKLYCKLIAIPLKQVYHSMLWEGVFFYDRKKTV